VLPPMLLTLTPLLALAPADGPSRRPRPRRPTLGACR
jgi:hypothetical protein